MRVNSMKKLLTRPSFLLLASSTLLLGVSVPTNTAQASPIKEHAKSSCYETYWTYGGWGYSSTGKVNINYTYTKKGKYDYSYRQEAAGRQWSSHFSFFNIKKVTSKPNLTVVSDNYGDTGWVGKAYYTRSPKEILINEWYHANKSYYGFTEYERTAIHELGHTHGLNHTSCKYEIMSNNEDRDISQTHLGNGDVSGIRDIY